jgi:hypothetical protein
MATSAAFVATAFLHYSAWVFGALPEQLVFSLDSTHTFIWKNEH